MRKTQKNLLVLIDLEDEDNETKHRQENEKRLKFSKFPRFKMLSNNKLIKFKLGLDFGMKAMAKIAMLITIFAKANLCGLIRMIRKG